MNACFVNHIACSTLSEIIEQHVANTTGGKHNRKQQWSSKWLCGRLWSSSYPEQFSPRHLC